LKKRNPHLLDIAVKGSAAVLNALSIHKHFTKPKRKTKRKARRTPEQRAGETIANGRGRSGVRSQESGVRVKKNHSLMTYDIAMAAGRDAGNRHARKAGRELWNRSDFNHAAKVFNK